MTVFKPGTVSPYVVGQIQHEDSGLSLTAGKTKVELTNLNVDPTLVPCPYDYFAASANVVVQVLATARPVVASTASSGSADGPDPTTRRGDL